jgi:hypothetical protein
MNRLRHRYGRAADDRYLDLLKQGFMEPHRERKVKAERPMVVCDRCKNWHREGKHIPVAVDAEQYLDRVFLLLPAAPRAWAQKTRAEWLPFALSHARLVRKSIPTSSAKDLAEAIEGAWRDHGSPT